MPGLFDLLMAARGAPDPTQQLAASLGQGPGAPGSPAGPQPLAQGGGSPPQGGGPPGANPGAAPGQPQPPQAPQQPQILQSPPDLAQAYLALAGRDQASNQFYSGLGLLAAGMYPGRNPNASMKWAQGMQQDPNSMFNSLVQIHGMQQQQASLDAFNRSIPDMMKQTGLTADEIRANPQAATELMGKIAATNAGLSSDPTMQEMNRAKGVYMAQNGITDPNDPRIPDKYKYPAQYKANTDADVTEQRTAANDKINATSSFSKIDPTLAAQETNLEWLSAHKDAVIKAIQNPNLSSNMTGSFASAAPGLTGIDQDVLTARVKIDQLKKELYADRFAGTKNIRSNTEANNLGAAATLLDSRNNDPQTITDELGRLQNDTYTARANLAGAAGKVIPAKYRGLADSAYLDSNSLLYNGAKNEDVPDFSKMSDADADAAFSKLSPGQVYIGPDGRSRKK